MLVHAVSVALALAPRLSGQEPLRLLATDALEAARAEVRQVVKPDDARYLLITLGELYREVDRGTAREVLLEAEKLSKDGNFSERLAKAWIGLDDDQVDRLLATITDNLSRSSIREARDEACLLAADESAQADILASIANDTHRSNLALTLATREVKKNWQRALEIVRQAKVPLEPLLTSLARDVADDLTASAELYKRVPEGLAKSWLAVDLAAAWAKKDAAKAIAIAGEVQQGGFKIAALIGIAENLPKGHPEKDRQIAETVRLINSFKPNDRDWSWVSGDLLTRLARLMGSAARPLLEKFEKCLDRQESKQVYEILELVAAWSEVDLPHASGLLAKARRVSPKAGLTSSCSGWHVDHRYQNYLMRLVEIEPERVASDLRELLKLLPFEGDRLNLQFAVERIFEASWPAHRAEAGRFGAAWNGEFLNAERVHAETLARQAQSDPAKADVPLRQLVQTKVQWDVTTKPVTAVAGYWLGKGDDEAALRTIRLLKPDDRVNVFLSAAYKHPSKAELLLRSALLDAQQEDAASNKARSYIAIARAARQLANSRSPN